MTNWWNVKWWRAQANQLTSFQWEKPSHQLVIQLKFIVGHIFHLVRIFRCVGYLEKMAAGGPFDWCATVQSSGVSFVFFCFSYWPLARQDGAKFKWISIENVLGRTNKIKMNGMWRDGRTRPSDALRLVAASWDDDDAYELISRRSFIRPLAQMDEGTSLTRHHHHFQPNHFFSSSSLHSRCSRWEALVHSDFFNKSK